MYLLIYYPIIGFLLFVFFDVLARYFYGKQNAYSFADSIFFIFLWPVILVFMLKYSEESDESN